MPHVVVRREVEVPESFRVSAIRGMFDIPRAQADTFEVEIDFPIERSGDWTIGAIVGASGSGKTTIARQVFGSAIRPDHLEWDERPIVEAFPEAMSVEEITRVLTAVGLSSVPTWQRPYQVLSTGEQFRASMARLLSDHEAANGGSEAVPEGPQPLVIDEFTSVVDRTVARAVSSAVERFVRASKGSRLVVVSCHKDIVPWLRPDWVLDLDARRFLRGDDAQRPGIELRVYSCGLDPWPAFARHHYLSHAINRSAICFLGTVTFTDEGVERPAAFTSLINQLRTRDTGRWRRLHRTVVLPDFQGIGIGTSFTELVGDWMWDERRLRVSSTTAARPLIHHRRRHPDRWRLVRGPHTAPETDPTMAHIRRNSGGRLTTSWEYIPAGLRDPQGTERPRSD